MDIKKHDKHKWGNYLSLCWASQANTWLTTDQSLMINMQTGHPSIHYQNTERTGARGLSEKEDKHKCDEVR